MTCPDLTHLFLCLGWEPRIERLRFLCFFLIRVFVVLFGVGENKKYKIRLENSKRFKHYENYLLFIVFLCKNFLSIFLMLLRF